MEKTTILEIPQEEIPKLEAALTQAVARFQEVESEHAARQIRIASLSAETDQALEAIKRSLANVEQHLSTTSVPLHLQ